MVSHSYTIVHITSNNINNHVCCYNTDFLNLYRSLKDAYMEYPPPFFEEYKEFSKKLEYRLNFYKHSSPF